MLGQLAFQLLLKIIIYCDIKTAKAITLYSPSLHKEIITSNIYKILLHLHLPNFEEINHQCYEQTLSPIKYLNRYVKINDEFESSMLLFKKNNRLLCNFSRGKYDHTINMCIYNIYLDKIKNFIFTKKNYYFIKNLGNLFDELVWLRNNLTVEQIQFQSRAFIPFKEILNYCFSQDSCVWNNCFIKENTIRIIIDLILDTYLEEYLDSLRIDFDAIINNFCLIFMHPNLGYMMKVYYLKILTDKFQYSELMGGMIILSSKYYLFLLKLINSLLSSVHYTLNAKDAGTISKNISDLLLTGNNFSDTIQEFFSRSEITQRLLLETTVDIYDSELMEVSNIYTEEMLLMINSIILNPKKYDKLKKYLTEIDGKPIRNIRIIVDMIVKMLKIIYRDDNSLKTLDICNSHTVNKVNRISGICKDNKIIGNILKYYLKNIKIEKTDRHSFKKYLRSSILNEIAVNIFTFNVSENDDIKYILNFIGNVMFQ